MNELFSIINGGINMRHPLTFRMSKPHGIPCYVLLSLKSNAIYNINGVSMKGRPNEAIIISPNTPYYYENPDGVYIDDWLRFESHDPTLFDKMNFPLNTLIYLADSRHINIIFQEIIWEYNYSREEFKKQNVSILLQVLINKLMSYYLEIGSDDNYSPFHSKLRDLRLRIQSDVMQSYKAENVASTLGISTSYFQHLYRKLFGISFHKDVIRFRIDQAKYLIAHTELTLNDISEMCGYSSEVHFFRQFKKETGRNPSDYRNMPFFESTSKY